MPFVMRIVETNGGENLGIHDTRDVNPKTGPYTGVGYYLMVGVS